MPDLDMPSLPQQFCTTRWSLVIRAHGEGDEAKKALEDLCQTYWFPLYAWCRRYGLSVTDAEDMVQGLFHKILTKRLFDSADSSRGKLRSFLLTILRRHIQDEQGKSSAARRGGGKVISFDSAQAEAWYTEESIEGENADHLFDRQWALTVLSNVIAKLEKQAAKRNKAENFKAMSPFLNKEGSEAAYQSEGKRLGMTAGSFRVAVHRLRNRFKDALRAEIMETLPDGANADEEIGYLWKALHGI